MATSRRPMLWTIALAGLAGSAVVPGLAQDGVGIVRISDQSAPAVAPMAATPAPAAAGGMVDGSCPECYGRAGGAGRHGHFHGLFQEHYCKHSPDHGYALPARYPIARHGVQYSSHLPSGWYGMPGVGAEAAPVVYQPTDTTQLGFYYQHVPFWQPQPGRLPARPIPSQWHSYARYGKHGHGLCRHGNTGGSCPYCQGGVTMEGTTVTPAPTTAPINGNAPTPIPESGSGFPPAPNENLPPEPLDSAESMHIRRAGY